MDGELVWVAINGFTKKWATFLQGIIGRDKLPDWECLWSDFTQEELRLSLVEASSSSGKGAKVEKEEENLALASKSGKAKGKKGQGEAESS